jgi:hypothetical protein
MSGRKAKQARKEQGWERDVKRPTRRYMTAKERQEKRRREAEQARKTEALVERIAAPLIARLDERSR